MPAGKRNVSGNRSVLAEREGGNRHVVEEIDDQIKTLAAEARQNFYHADAAGERPVDGVDDQRDAEPDEHPLPVAALAAMSASSANAAPIAVRKWTRPRASARSCALHYRKRAAEATMRSAESKRGAAGWCRPRSGA